MSSQCLSMSLGCIIPLFMSFFVYCYLQMYLLPPSKIKYIAKETQRVMVFKDQLKNIKSLGKQLFWFLLCPVENGSTPFKYFLPQVLVTWKRKIMGHFVMVTPCP